MSPPNGAELIATERARQVEQEGWSAAHDAEHTDGSLARAAACYADPSRVKWRRRVIVRAENGGRDLTVPYSDEWPWDAEWWKPGDDDIRRLVKAGALIAAEIDRLQADR